jgi:hypothetical protein
MYKALGRKKETLANRKIAVCLFWECTNLKFPSHAFVMGPMREAQHQLSTQFINVNRTYPRLCEVLGCQYQIKLSKDKAIAI